MRRCEFVPRETIKDFIPFLKSSEKVMENDATLVELIKHLLAGEYIMFACYENDTPIGYEIFVPQWEGIRSVQTHTLKPCAKQMLKFIESWGRKMGFKYIDFFTKRNYKVIEKKYGFKFEGHYMRREI